MAALFFYKKKLDKNIMVSQKTMSTKKETISEKVHLQKQDVTKNIEKAHPFPLKQLQKNILDCDNKKFTTPAAASPVLPRTAPDKNHIAWKNKHLKMENGDIYRIRLFNDDGPNGIRLKFVLYKEADNGFPEIINVPEKIKDLPPQKKWEHFQSKGEVIYDEVAKEWHWNDEQLNLFQVTIDDQITRIDVQSAMGAWNCRAISDHKNEE
jgi:hypothetical protein